MAMKCCQNHLDAVVVYDSRKCSACEQIAAVERERNAIQFRLDASDRMLNEKLDQITKALKG